METKLHYAVVDARGTVAGYFKTVVEAFQNRDTAVDYVVAVENYVIRPLNEEEESLIQ